MCITVSLLQKLFDAHDKTELLGAPLGDDRLTRWAECLSATGHGVYQRQLGGG